MGLLFPSARLLLLALDSNTASGSSLASCLPYMLHSVVYTGGIKGLRSLGVLGSGLLFGMPNLSTVVSGVVSVVRNCSGCFRSFTS